MWKIFVKEKGKDWIEHNEKVSADQAVEYLLQEYDSVDSIYLHISKKDFYVSLCLFPENILECTPSDEFLRRILSNNEEGWTEGPP